jgi:anti-sigma regulatory factor (Ser/Thr protein kinase)
VTADALVRHVLPAPGDAASAGQRRRFVREVLDEAGRESWSEAASLAVSELVTNAVLHAHTRGGARVVDRTGPRAHRGP